MFVRIELWHVFLLSFFLGSFNVNSLPCHDRRCKTELCDSTGACICNIPDPSTILDGDRPFLGGKFCDEEMTMCDGTNSFWCEHGGTCEEIVQGENYTCRCPTGFTGEHCENSGAPCGQIFCFHEAECLAGDEDHVCDCHPNWQGSADCSLPTKTQTDTSADSTTTGHRGGKRSNSTNWIAVVLGISFSAGAVAVVAIYVKKLCSKKERETARFQQLSQLQNADLLVDDDEDDSVLVVGAQRDTSHL